MSGCAVGICCGNDDVLWGCADVLMCGEDVL